MTELVGVGFHEFDANWIFEYDDDSPEEAGLRPFYAFERLVREHDGATRTKVEVGEETYLVQFKYEKSGIGGLNHPTCDLDSIREFRINWQRDDDTGQCSGSFHIAPRSPGMVDRDGEPIQNAVDLVGVNVRAQGSNLPFNEYLPLFRTSVTSLGISRRYWRDEHLHQDQYSNVQDGELYVRLAEGEGGGLIAADGALARIANLAAGDRSGYTKHVRDDRERPGHYHTATIGDERASHLIDMHSFAKEIKFYYANNADSYEVDHPLAHPKLGVSFQVSKTDQTIYWDDLDRFVREIEEVLLNVLNWEGYPVTAEAIAADNGGPYVDVDEYFDPEPSHRNRRLVGDPTPELKEQQGDILIRHLVDGFEASDLDLLGHLVADGGEVAPQDVADATGWTLETIYNAIERLDDLVSHSYADLELRSHYLAERIAVAVQEARDSAEDALESLARELRESRGREIHDEALTRWVDRLGVDVENRDEASVLLRTDTDFDSWDDASQAFLEGLYAWMRSGWKREAFRSAEAVFYVDGRRQQYVVRNLISTNAHR